MPLTLERDLSNEHFIWIPFPAPKRGKPSPFLLPDDTSTFAARSAKVSMYVVRRSQYVVVSSILSLGTPMHALCPACYRTLSKVEMHPTSTSLLVFYPRPTLFMHRLFLLAPLARFAFLSSSHNLDARFRPAPSHSFSFRPSASQVMFRLESIAPCACASNCIIPTVVFNLRIERIQSQPYSNTSHPSHLAALWPFAPKPCSTYSHPPPCPTSSSAVKTATYHTSRHTNE